MFEVTKITILKVIPQLWAACSNQLWFRSFNLLRSLASQISAKLQAFKVATDRDLNPDWPKTWTSWRWTPYSFKKNKKRHFFWDIGNSFHEVTQIGLEPHQIFSFWNISTNTVARGVQSFGRNGPWWAGRWKNGQNFWLKFAQTCDEQMLKFSRRYLDSCLI